MKSILKSALALCLTTVMAVGFTACNFGEKEVVNAYDIAVKNGYVGTEEQWLASLKGTNGKDGESLDINDVYDAAVEHGYTGTFLEFIKEYLSVPLSENNDTETIAKNISSLVSVNCGFITEATQRVPSAFPGVYTTQTVLQASGSAGSGVIIELDKATGSAVIVTNYHVLYDNTCNTSNKISESIYVYPYGSRNYFDTGADENGVLTDVNKDGKKDKNDQGDFGGDGIKATFIGGAMDYDIALLQVTNSAYLSSCAATVATLGDSNEITAGEKVFAIGNANGEGISATAGVVSVESESIVMSSMANAAQGVTYRVLRTDAAINHGNSGGGLFNAQGELIGITNAKNVEDETDNMGYALPISQVKNLIDNIRDNGGVVKRAMFGVMSLVTSSNTKLSQSGKIVITEEVTVVSVESGAAADGKLQVGDVIKTATVGGKEYAITRTFYLNDLLLTVRKGDTVKLKVIRESTGAETEVTVTFDKDDYFVIYQ